MVPTNIPDKDRDGMVEATGDPETNEILSETHYYPFGMNMEGPWMQNAGRENPYLYNGKELNAVAQRRPRQACGEEFGLNWLSYGAREYDPAIGRWMSVDPLAEKFTYESAYGYAGNNPIRNIDVEGKFKLSQEFINRFPKFSRYLMATYQDYMVKSKGKVTEMLHSRAFVTSLINNSASLNADGNVETLRFGDVLNASTFGQGPEVSFFDDADEGYGIYASDFIGSTGEIRLSLKGLLEFENAKTFEDAQGALTYLVSSLYHEFLEGQSVGDRNVSELGPKLMKGAKIFEEEVWGFDVFGLESNESMDHPKRAIRISRGKDPKFFWRGVPVYIIDASVIPNPPEDED